MPRLLIAGLAGFLCLLAAACDEALSDVAGPTPNLAPTFQSIQRDIFDNADAAGRRACTQCHNAAGRLFAGRLELTSGVSYAALVGAASFERPAMARVSPGDVDNSYLVHKLEGRAGIVGQRMPLGGPYLSEGQIRIIKRWIEIGAPNN